MNPGRIAILVAATICVVSWTSWASASADRRGLVQAPKYQPGESLADVPEIAGASSGALLVIYVNSKCVYCTKSIPLYRELMTGQTGHDGPSLMFVSREPLASLTEYLEANGIHGAVRASLPQHTPFKSRLTPAILAVNENETIDRVWLGWPQGEVANDVRKYFAAQLARPLN